MTKCMTFVIGMVLLMLGGVGQAALMTYTGTGNWTDAGNWSTAQPGALDDAQLNFGADVTINSDVGTINTLTTFNSVALTMDGGTLDAGSGAASNWGSVDVDLSNGSSLTGSHFVRFGTVGDSSITVDNSTFTWNQSVQGWDPANADRTITVRNGSTYNVAQHFKSNSGSTTFNIEGGGNTVTIGNFTANSEDMAFNLTLGSTGFDAVDVTNTLDLGGIGDTLVIDVGGYDFLTHGAYVPLFSFNTLNGGFETVSVINGSGTPQFSANAIGVTVIPEPSAVLLMGALLGILGFVRRLRCR